MDLDKYFDQFFRIKDEPPGLRLRFSKPSQVYKKL